MTERGLRQGPAAAAVAALLVLVLAAAAGCGDSASSSDAGGDAATGDAATGDAAATPCKPPAGATALAATAFSAPAGCQLRPQAGARPEVITDETGFETWFNCLGTPKPTSGVDFSKSRIVVLHVRQNPNSSLAWVAEVAGEIVVSAEVRAYCGGAAPPDSYVYALVPADGKTVKTEQCRTGKCIGPPPP